MFFSIVVPVYNVEAYLDKCLLSLLDQNFNDKEIIIVNDGSTDRSYEICKDYNEKYEDIKLVSQKNAGLSAARNRGIKESLGKYILFVDSDDFIKPNVLSDMHDLLLSNDYPDILFGNSYVNYYKDKSESEVSLKLDSSRILSKNHENLLYYIFNESDNIIWSAWRNVYKKDLIVDNNIYFKDGLVSEDALWTPQIILKTNSAILHENPFYYYRIFRENSISNVISDKKVSDFFWVVNYWLDKSEEVRDPKLKDLIKEVYSSHFYNYMKYIPLLSTDIQKEILLKLKTTDLIQNISGKNGERFKKIVKLYGLDKAILFEYYKYRVKKIISR